MNRIESITSVRREAYKDIIIHGDERTEVEAPVLGFYSVELRDKEEQHRRFDVEVRSSPNGLQVDWYDDLDDFLLGIESRDEANKLREQISIGVYEAHDQASRLLAHTIKSEKPNKAEMATPRKPSD